ncbi:DUF317 domain-containing protein [Streptomyces sp. NPDC005012]|uniref:DUF317 domain-containing protein n=1 Tax=Streptomyces sp. NPDC005012 TaxID=3154558 RepID=UPI0033ABEB1E
MTALLTGSQSDAARSELESAGWEYVTARTWVLARIDHEEPYWAEQTAQKLTASGITVDITPRLREAMDEEWTWANYPMPWCTRTEMREVSDEAQKIYDDIRHGRLLIHAHAPDGHTTVAVVTYPDTGKSVYLHGEDHLRTVASSYESPAQALADFQKYHGSEMRLGPAPQTSTERAADDARTLLPVTRVESEPNHGEPETVPTYAADAGDDALLDAFLDTHRDWQKWRTWSDDTTHAIHEDQTLRIERVHETAAHETAWTVAAYDTPISERAWVLTATGGTPAPVLQELLDHLADNANRNTNTRIDEKTVTAATQPLIEAGWKHTMDGRGICWTSPRGDAAVKFDAFAAQHPDKALTTWTAWASAGPTQLLWTLTASTHTPTPLLAALTETLATGTGTGTRSRSRSTRYASLSASPSVIPDAHAAPGPSLSKAAPTCPPTGAGRRGR